ncbi:MAG: hypothetical protein BGO49_08970 [Planctomycetales bacterium 71-10]|nr:MAG: hypothetical protein BGO49_08970 [Planctomycetales bacterium 71-10]
MVRASIDAPPPHPRGWARTIAPAFLGVVTWFPLLDALGRVDGGESLLLRWSTCLLALGACYALVYLPLAGLGLRARSRLPVVAAEALGAGGAEWIADVLYGLFAALWGSVAIWYSVRLTLDGLAAWGLLDPAATAPGRVGGGGLESPLVLASLAWWAFIIVAANGLNLMGVIAALMRVYAPFAGVLLAATAAWSAWGGDGPTALSRPADLPAPRIFQYVFGAFAFAGLMAVEWGAATRDRRDVRLGGWTSILAAGAVTTLAALTLGPGGARSFLVGGVGGWLDRRACGSILLLFGLASLAPACYASALFASRARARWPGLGKWKGVGLSYLLFVAPGAAGIAKDVEALAGISGALFAPLAGVLAVEAIRRDGRAVRPGWDAAGVAAWGAGVLVGLAPIVVPALGWAQPAALIGWAVAAVVYAALSRSRAERSA